MNREIKEAMKEVEEELQKLREVRKKMHKKYPYLTNNNHA